MAKYVAERARGSGACFHTCEFTNWHERTLACGTSTCLSALLFLLFDFILFKWISPYSIWSVQQVRPSMCETPPILPDGSPRQRSRIRSLARSMGCFFFFFGYHINLPGGRFFFFFFRDFSHISGGAGTFPCRCVLYMRSASVFRMLLA